MSRKVISREDVGSVIGLYNANHKVSEIVNLTGVNWRSVYRLISKFVAEGSDKLPTPKRTPGRPRLTSERTCKVISRQVNANPTLTARKIKETNPGLLGKVSLRSVQQLLHDKLDYRSFQPRRKPLLTVAQKKKRISFAKKYSVWTLEEWRKVLWSDEATFTVSGCGHSRVYRRPDSDPLDPRYTVKTVKHPDSVMVWGSFGYHGVGELVVLEKNVKVNQFVYLELLCDALPDAFEKTRANVFMQDGAPAHTARSVTQWLQDCQISYFKDWPGNSPDINPIENLWGLMKRQLRDLDTSSVPKLITAIQQLWAGFSAEYLQRLADSVPRRLKEVLIRKGNTTRY